ncbi:MAG: DEAD/DEAH box helicase [Flavobacteriales bacterium]|nr:DEAD/DEAH box helicase [Flavobacteriales bacterium]
MEQKKSQKEILSKLGITKLNQMQSEAREVILTHPEVVLLSPTGTGKTLAFLLPIMANLSRESKEIQALILVPSRELAIQIEQVIREMGSGFKANAVYGGRSGSKDIYELKNTPAILVGTPGRIADHIRRENINTKEVKTLVLDEFDKSLEDGFEAEMTEIVEGLINVKKKILTSATQKVEVPEFVGLTDPKKIDYIKEATSQLVLKTIVAATEDKLEALEDLLSHVGEGNGIIFCNFKATINTVSEFLDDKRIGHACFYGGLEQRDRERSLIKFRNGTHKILLATDLAARGIDVPELDFIVHFELPVKEDEFIHRNGRTARMHNEGTAYIIQGQRESLPEFIKGSEELNLKSGANLSSSGWETLYISGGRKDKISKGDIAGLFFKQGNLNKDELGVIELKQDCAFVAVSKAKSRQLIEDLNNSRLKKKKVRISLLK